MRNATVDRRLVRPSPRIRIAVLAAVIVTATALFLIESLAPNDSVFERTAASSHAADLTRAQQAEADRLTGLAEARTMGEVLRHRQAEAERWEALAEHHRQLRAKRAETDRLTGLAESQGLVTP